MPKTSIAQTKESFDVASYKAAPGFVLVEPIQDAGYKSTAGGVLVVESCDTNRSMVARARVISAGVYLTHRSDRKIYDEGWLRPGTEVEYIPSETWTLRGVASGRTVLAIRSQHVLTIPNE